MTILNCVTTIYNNVSKNNDYLHSPHLGPEADVGCHYVYGYLNTCLLYNTHGVFEEN